jgi:ribosomal protein L11 methyltransferase
LTASATLYRWSRLISAKWEDAWAERLQFLGPGRAVFIGWPDSRSMRVEAFCDERTAQRLVKEFGGKVTKARDWTAQPDQARKPLRIRGRLTIHGDEESFSADKGRGAKLLIPAGMAFGTGDHATTSSCMRMLCDIAGELPEGWRAIDAGTGTGILALAAVTLGASEVEAFDFDPACVRIAKENARANGIRSVKIARADVLQWKAVTPVELVMANLYSDLLIQAAPALKRGLKRKGWFIFSGVLRTQLPEVVAALEKLGLAVERTVLRGKWSAGLCRRN